MKKDPGQALVTHNNSALRYPKSIFILMGLDKENYLLILGNSSLMMFAKLGAPISANS